MIKRILSGLIGLFLLFFTVHRGGLFILLAAFLMSVLGLREFYKALEKGGYAAHLPLALLATASLFLGNLTGYHLEFVFFSTYLLFFLLLIQNIFSEKDRLVDAGLTLLGFLYVPVSLYHIVLFIQSDQASLVWLVFIIAWMTDTSAYFTGVFFGKTPLIPSVSPKKTVEGAIGGVIGATLLGLAFLWWKQGGIDSPLIIPLLMTGSILSQLGDLLASRIKRSLEIKDFGQLMPGHGGVLDRFDSILIVGPFVYYAIALLAKAPF